MFGVQSRTDKVCPFRQCSGIHDRSMLPFIPERLNTSGSIVCKIILATKYIFLLNNRAPVLKVGEKIPTASLFITRTVRSRF